MSMEIRKCDKGHFYDATAFASCPLCSGRAEGNQQGWQPSENKMEFHNFQKPEPIKWEPKNVIPLGNGDDIEEYEPTEAVSFKRGAYGTDPVVGWLICTAGPNRGKDYRLHSGTNFIGRSEKMDVCVRNDNMINRRNAAALSYDERTNIYFIERGDGKNQVYINGNVVRQSEDLKIYDRINIGNSEFLFFPFCGENFRWKDI